MAATVAGLLILAIFFTSQMMMFRANTYASLLTTGTNKQAVHLSGEQARTMIEVQSATTDGLCNLTVDLANTGAVAVVDPSRMDVIAQFPGGANLPRRLSYAGSGPPGLDEWASTTISGTFDPGIFDPGENMQIDAKLSLSAGDATGTVTVATPNGVTATASFPAVLPRP